MRFIYFIKPPKIIKRFFNQLIWENPEPKVCLTFDDGPFPEATEKILKTLDQYQAKAIFFLTGWHVARQYNLVDKITDDGHFVANHSFHHSKKMTLMSSYEIQNEILDTEQLLFYKKNYLKIFRPPYGRINLKMYSEITDLGYKVMMWTLLTEDYLGDFGIVKKNLDKYLANNSIVVFHNNPKSLHIIEKSLDYTFNLIHKRGYEVASTFKF